MRTSLSRLLLLCSAILLAGSSAASGVAGSFAGATLVTLEGMTRSVPGSSGAKLTFRRIFKSSSPEFIEISVQEDSDDASYEIRQLDDDPGAAKFQVSSALRGKMFALTQQLNRFQGQDLDVHRKIANLGEKTFRWEHGSEVHEVTFNYTLNSTASQLLQIFEGLARQQELLMLLERRMKYDRLGINDALLQFETELKIGRAHV